MHVSEILKSKGTDVMTIPPDATIGHLAERLRDARVGALVVSANGDRVEGIVSERDIVHGLAKHGSSVYRMEVEEIMTRNVITCQSVDTLGKVAEIMTRLRFRHVPVVDDGHLVGVVSIGDVLKTRLDEMELEANVLRDVAIAAR